MSILIKLSSDDTTDFGAISSNLKMQELENDTGLNQESRNQTEECFPSIQLNVISAEPDKEKVDRPIDKISACSEHQFHCAPCNRSFGTKVALVAHSRSHRFKCEPCNRSFGTKKALRLHSSFHNRVKKSNACSHVSKDCKCLNHNNLEVSPKQANHWRCSQCEKVCGSQELLDRHVQSKHTSRTCNFCGKVFRFTCLLEVHMTVHTKEKLFQCEHCKKAFATVHRLKSHSRSHTDKDFRCEPCNLSFPRKSRLEDHIALTHDSGASSSKTLADEGQAENLGIFHAKYSEGVMKITRPGKCPKCNQMFKYVHQLRAHMVIHTREKPFHCPKCAKSYAYQGALHNHFQKHKRSVNASENRDLPFPLDHVMEEETEAKGTGSESLPNVSTSTRSLKPGLKISKIPVKQKHSNNLKFHRQKLPEPFSQNTPKISLKVNLQTENFPIVPILSEIPALPKPQESSSNEITNSLTCPHCGKTFDFEHLFIRHIAGHTREPRFQCSFCNEAFKWPVQLYYHVKRCHPEKRVNTKNKLKSVASFASISTDSEAPSSSVTQSTINRQDGETADRPVQACPTLLPGDALTSHECTAHPEQNVLEKKFKCTRCDTEISFSEISDHMQIHLTESLVEPPTVPHDEYRSANNVAQPSRRRGKKSESDSKQQTSSNIKKHNCHICSKTFNTRGNLQVHVKYHLNIRDFKCGSCEQAFFKKTQLIAHQIDHTGVKPFVCHLCYLGFLYKHNLKKHLKSHEDS